MRLPGTSIFEVIISIFMDIHNMSIRVFNPKCDSCGKPLLRGFLGSLKSRQIKGDLSVYYTVFSKVQLLFIF